MKRRDGFTLAEVLITLTIIGVISALTLPAIQSNTAASRNRSTLKNTMAILSQAAQNNMATEGWNFTHIVDFCGGSDDDKDHNSIDNYSICGLMNSNLSGETFLGQPGYGRPDETGYRPVGTMGYGGSCICYLLANGAVVGFENSVRNCTEDSNERCRGFIDVNGLTGPHREITCSNNTKTYLWQNDDRSRTCEVERTTNADIFPIRYHGNTVELASDAARSFLNAR